MNIDFSPCFNWNTNLIFGWISAEYETGKKNVKYYFKKKKKKTSVTLWDNIMLRSEPQKHLVNFDAKSFEYPIVDVYKTLK